MDNAKILNTLFQQAVSAINAGNVAQLEALLVAHPHLVQDRLAVPGAWLYDVIGNALDGFFQKPYLLWFVAEDPVRTGKLPHNIVEVTQVILQAAQREQGDNLQEQLDYALRLVAWSLVAPACGVQIALLDVLLTAGASADGSHNRGSALSGALGRCQPARADGHIERQTAWPRTGGTQRQS
jgi:hypothetical protein